MIELSRHGAVAELRIRHAKELNPFTRAMTRELITLCAEVEADDALEGAFLWGGEGRSFSVGGDFHDLRQIKGPAEGEEYLRDIVRSYQAVLAITKPVVAAVDHHAIGQGLQVALMADWRVGSERSSYHMPELANGMPCPLGSLILETMLGRAAMLHWVVGCGKLDAEAARREHLIDETRPHAELKDAALARLDAFRGYPSRAFRLTKRIHNQRFSERLEGVREAAAKAHAASYFSGQAEAHFARIVGGGR
jgi:enoyl-CoA hydratase/carnithine racemase